MQHHLDEFSVTDVRHTLCEVWRVIRCRKWLFIFPFCLVGALALACSLWLPRKYSTYTIIKREQDPVFANMVGTTWTQSYNEIRQRIPEDLRDPKIIEAVLEELDLPDDAERFANGELTPQSETARRRLAGEIAAGLTVTSLEASANRDVVSIALNLPEPRHAPEILGRIRDRYIAAARGRMVRVLQDVEQFFLAEAERCRGQLAGLQKKLLEYDFEYPGIDPDLPDRSRGDQAALVAERVERQRVTEKLTEDRVGLAQELADILAGECDEEELDTEGTTTPNPRHAELEREIEQVLQDIAECKTQRLMTDQHPVVQRLQQRLAVMETELSKTPAETLVFADPAQSPEEAERASKMAARKAEDRIAELDEKVAGHHARVREIDDRIDALERRRAMAVAQRPEYMKLKQEAGRVETEMAGWVQNIAPVRNILTVEDRNRTIHFTMVEDVTTVARPISPNARMILMVCLAIGAAAGGAAVLLAELIDRSYRTIKQLRTTLGVPVIEGIDEIMTRSARRRRLVRGLVLLPTAAGLAFGTMLLAGAMAYLSIESPRDYELLKDSPRQVVRAMVG